MPESAGAPTADQLEVRRLLASSASYIGLGSLDVAGPTAAIGPGGEKNLHVQVTVPHGANTPSVINYLNIVGPGGFQWTYGMTGTGVANPQANPVIAIANGVVSQNGTSETFDAYFSPVVTSVDGTTGATSFKTLTNGQPLSLTVAYTYANGSSVTESASSNPALVVTPQDLSGTLTDATPALQPVTVGSYTGSFQGQMADGNAHIQISGLPASITPGTAELSDVAGLNWLVGATYGRFELAMTITQASGSSTADIAFPAERDEAGTTLTFRYQLGSAQWYVTDVTLGASQHTDPNLRYGGPVNASTTPIVVSATGTTNMVSYTDNSGLRQMTDFQQLLNTKPQIITLNEGTYNLSEILTIGSPLILQGVDANVTLNFTNLPTVTQGVINLNASHVTLNQFKVRFQDPTVNFTSGHRAIISDEENQPYPRVDLNVKNLDIQAPTETSPVYYSTLQQNLTLPTTYFDEFDAGTIQNNVIYGGTINVQGGPWVISGNHVLGAVKGTLNTGAIGISGGHDISILSNYASDADPTNHGLIDRFLTANRSGYGFTLTGNHVSNNVGLIAPVVDGTPSTPQNPRNEPEEIVFEDYNKIFEGSVAAVGVSASSAAGDNRRVISIPTKELDIFSSLTDYIYTSSNGGWCPTPVERRAG